MTAATLREMVGHKALKNGTLVWEFATPGIGHLLRAAGCEFVFLCAEYSGFGIDTLKSALRYFEAAGVPALVRPPGKTYPHIANTLDIGAEGLILPMVASGEEARRIVEYAKYAPLGRRGVGLGTGYDFIALGTDTATYLDALRAAVSGLRTALSEGPLTPTLSPLQGKRE